ncbi:FAD-linked oxidase C-terminal domain-containing protein, partial [Pontibacter sp. JAM-7]|uniref:FAD-linked oxidase C-terminal domain-containing protein n=1 Tax=Pontibacter sp. JAM-7 TaxID=3366581 RepID=UPI003AF76722
PKHAALVNIKYDSFEASLRDAKDLMSWQPTSIETIDSKVLNLAMGDIVWETVSQYFPQQADEPEIQGINLVEYTDDDPEALRQRVERLAQHLQSVAGEVGKSFGYSVVYGAAEINKVWTMRKKAVGLLGNAKGEERPIPFVEDTAVPPEHLADFIMEFRKVLDDRNLAYGMFGHVDAGVLHVRPAIDMKDKAQEHLIREITDQVVALTQKYHGLLWGEHGKGVRSEYAPEFFGELYPELQRVKAAFDPRNQFNPGKIAAPAIEGAELLKIDQVATRGQYDRQINVDTRNTYDSAMFCNGNGACFNYDPNDAMCPSWKGTRQRINSPKGRSSLIREWLRLMEQKGSNLALESERAKRGFGLSRLPQRIKNTLKKRQGEYDFSHEVHESMMACLACKSCAGQCPIKVNVPDFRSRFLELYYSRYLRPAKDYLVGSLEYMIPVMARFPAPYNWLMSQPLLKGVFKRQVGMVDSPLICRNTLVSGLRARGIDFATPAVMKQLTEVERENGVILVQDAFTSYFETQLVLDLADLLTGLGFHVLVAPFKPNGKPLHVHGFMAAFNRAANSNAALLKKLEGSGIPLVGIDPSMTLTYRQEYATTVAEDGLPAVQLLQEWLIQHLDRLSGFSQASASAASDFKLLAHCTEKTTAAASIRQWQQVFEAAGLNLSVEAVGCCGMSGTYGHETANLETSRRIYDLSWGPLVSDAAVRPQLVATGYSCRSQVKRLDQQQIPHPLQALLAQLRHSKTLNG